MNKIEDLIKEMNKGIEEYSVNFSKEFGTSINNLNSIFSKKYRIQKEKEKTMQDFKDFFEEKEEKTHEKLHDFNDLINKSLKDNQMIIKLILPGFDKKNIKVTENSIRYMITAINGEIKECVNTSFLIDDVFNVLIATNYINGVLSFVFNKKEETKNKVVEIKIN